MANLKHIKQRITAIENTASITQAMYNISISKLKKSQDLVNSHNAFMNRLNNVVNETAKVCKEHPMINQSDGKVDVYILLTSDRGLAGAYHNQLFKAFLEEVKDKDKSEYQVIVIGRKGYFFAKKRELPMLNTQVISNRDDLEVINFRKDLQVLKNMYVSGLISKVYLMHNHFVSTGTQEVVKEVLLPIKTTHNHESKALLDSVYMYDVSPYEIMDGVTEIYMESCIFGALADAKLSEHASRMLAMKNATDNAHKVIKELNVVYHRARQQAITNELIDVINGSNQ